MNLCFLRIPKTKTQAEDLFGSAWVYAETKEAHRLLKKDIYPRSQEDRLSLVNLQILTTFALFTPSNITLKSYSLELELAE